MYYPVRQTNVYLIHIHDSVLINNHFIFEYSNRGLLITTMACLRRFIPIGTTVLKSSMRNALESLTGYKSPHHIEFVNELPKRHISKVLLQRL